MHEATVWEQPTLEETAGKVCKGCGLWKSFGEFNKHPHGKYGYMARCKACVKASRVQTEWPEKKQCKGPCGEIKSIGEFHRSPISKDGHVSRCKACEAERGKARYAADRERIAAQHKEYYEANRDRILAQAREAGRARYWADPEKSREEGRLKRRRLYAADPEHYREASRVWRANNRDQAREVSRESQRRRQPHRKPEVKAYKLRWARANPDLKAGQQTRHRARKKTTMIVRWTPDQLAARLAMFGNRCWMCGGPATELDHVKPLEKGGAHVLANIRPADREHNARKQAQWFGVSETIARFRTWVPAPMPLP